MSRHQLPETTARLAAIINRAWLAIDANPRTYDAATYAAVRMLADAKFAAGLRALPVLAALKELHQQRRWQNSDVVVCDHCQTGWPCPDRQILSGERAAVAS